MTAAHNFFLCQSSRESPFVLMFGRDPITPFLSLLKLSSRYWGERCGHLHLDTLQQLYSVMAENLKREREKEKAEIETNLQNDLKIGDLMLVRNVNSGVFKLKYSPNYRIIAIYGNNHIAVKAPDGKVQVRHRGHIKKIEPVDNVISLVPNVEDYEKFGRKTKLLIHPDNIPDTNISLPSREQTEKVGAESEISENYQDSLEKLRKSTKGIPKNSMSQTKKTSEGSEIGKNYQFSCQKSETSNIEILNTIDCSNKELNEVNLSLISASCPSTVGFNTSKNVKVQQVDKPIWGKLKKLLCNKPVVKANKNLDFGLFL